MKAAQSPQLMICGNLRKTNHTSADVYDDGKVMVAERMDMARLTCVYPPMHILSTCCKRVFASLASGATQVELNIVYVQWKNNWTYD